MPWGEEFERFQRFRRRRYVEVVVNDVFNFLVEGMKFKGKDCDNHLFKFHFFSNIFTTNYVQVEWTIDLLAILQKSLDQVTFVVHLILEA